MQAGFAVRVRTSLGVASILPISGKKTQTLGAMEESTKWVAARELSHRGLGQPHDAALPSESDTAVLGVYFEKITSLELPKVLAENTNKVTLRFFKSRLHLRNNTL